MKRVLSMVLSLLMIVSIIPLGTMNASAASLDSRVEAAIQWAISIANDNSHGYSQANRNGPDYDCSSYVSTAFKNGGFSVSGSLNTGNMLNAFVSAGFTKYNKGDVALQRGDILLRPKTSSRYGHTELYIGNNQCVGAHNNYDGVTGDGNGREINVRSKSGCDFCNYADYTYVLRYEGPNNYDNYTYSFNFNANGGTLGSSGAFSVSYGDQFQVLNTTCTRSGYIWAGWNVKRNNDNKWYVDGQGWCTESQISNNGYIKKVYPNYKTLTFDDSWTSGIAGDCSYTFYAIWIQSRVDTLKVFLSPYGEGYDHITALNNLSSSGFAQDQIYAWYILYDGNTGELMNTYSDKTYSVELVIHDPNGELVFNYTYTDSSDANWIGVTPQMSGTYTATATISGAYSGSISTTYDVSYDTQLSSSHDSISLNLNGTNSVTPTVYIAGSHPGEYGVRYQLGDSSIASAAWTGNWNGNSTTIAVTGKKYGSTNLTISVYENYTGNKNVVASIVIPIYVSANSYTISYNANGGSGAPSSQTKYYGTDITLSSTVPTRSGYSFLGWSTSSTATSATYQPGSTFSSNANTTLYAVWKANPATLSTNSSNSAVISTGGEMKYFTYTPTTSGTYVIYSTGSDDTKVYLYNASGTELGNNDDGGDGTNFRLEYNLTAGTKYTFGVKYYNSSKTGTISFKFGNVYTITYNANGGTGAPSSQKKDYGTSITFSSTIPTRIGYTFEGWASFSSATSSAYQPGATYTSNIGTTLYAVWQANTYTVRYNSNGGSGSMSNSTHTYDTSKSLSSNGFSRSGYTFLGWATSSAATSATYTNGQSVKNLTSSNGATVDLYAVWSKIPTYTISYNANGGSGAPADQTKTKDVNLTLSSTVPTRTGYTFKGWTINSDATSSNYQPGDIFTSNENTTLYAIWSKDDVNLPSAYLKATNNLSNIQTVTINMYDDEGVFAYYWGTDSVYLNNEYRQCSFVATNINTQKEVSEPGVYGVTVVDVNGNVSATYIITFYETMLNTNGGNVSTASIITQSGLSITLPTPTRSGYDFLGWATSASATSATYQPGDSFTSNANTTLYAVWKLGCAGNNHSYSYAVTKNPTTSATGTLTGTCSKCSGTTTVTLPKLTTTDYTYKVTKAATCTATGTGRYTWKTTTYGSFYFDVTIAKTGHSYTSKVTAPTCTAQGYTTYTCSCGDSYKGNYTNATGHSYGYKATKNPTTSATGTLTGTCSKCSGTTTVTLPKLTTTDYTYKVTKAATCTATGTGRYTWKTTTYGSFYFDVTIAKTGHSYTSKVTDPSCTEQGYTTYTCTCGDTYKDNYTDATGHSYTYAATKKPTTSATGTLTGTCSKCSGTTTVTLPKLTTTDYTYKVTKAATCTATGTGRYTWKTTTHGSFYFDVTIAKTGHSYTSKVTDPSCTEQGYTTYTCTCGDSYKDNYINPTGHSYSYKVTKNPTTAATGTLTGTCSKCSGTTTVTLPKLTTTDYTYKVTKAATCTADGTGRYTWKTTTYGSFYFDVTIAKTGHSYTSKVTAPTCTAQGYTTYTCTCGDSYKDNYINPTGHSYSYKVTKNPTTAATGTLTGTCSKCSGTTTVTLPKLTTTDYTYKVTKAATCTADGTGRYTWKTTTYGSFYFDVTIAKTGHSYTSKVTDPSCTEQGYTTYTCTCGDSYKDNYTDATGHSYTYAATKKPTTSATGTLTGTCSKCSGTTTVTLPKLTTTDYTYKVTKAATCTATGTGRYTWKTTTYGSFYFDVTIAKTGHSFGNWQEHLAPTCTKDGEERRYCGDCSAYESRVIEASGHSLGGWTEYRAATCTKDGEERNYCAECSYYESRVIKSTGHSLGGWTEYKAATCTKNGEERNYCADCSYYESRVIKAAGHTLGSWTEYKAATCTKDGEERRYCANCSYYESQVIAATGHDYEDGVCTDCGEADPDYEPEEPAYNGLVVVDGVWGYYEGGVLQEDYTGLVPYGDKLFYVEEGILTFTYTGLVYYKDEWRYVANSELTDGYTGLVYFNDNWFYTVNSVIDWTFTGLVPYNGNYFYVQNNLLDWSYTGLGYHDGGWYFIQNGLLQKEYSGLVYFNDNWFYVEEGVLTYQYFGMVEHQGNMFYVQASLLKWDYTGLGYHEGAWYYFQNALYTPSFSGLVPFEGSLFYVKDGTVDWTYNGTATYEGIEYTVKNGVADL